MWKGFDPRIEPLESEILKEWTQDGVVLRVLRYRIGILNGKKPGWLVYMVFQGRKQYTKAIADSWGGQYADHKAPLSNAKKRGYATLSIAWAGRISTPSYRVSPNE